MTGAMVPRIEHIEITGAERERLLALDEGHFSDLKAIGISTKKLGRAVCAFAPPQVAIFTLGLAKPNC
jgi:hypothetical protein